MYKILDRNEMFKGHAVPDWATAVAYFKGSWYFEESLEQADGGRFERVGSGARRTYGNGATKGFSKAYLFTPLVEQDDPLPPAPKSVRYYNSFIMGNNDQNLTVEPAPEYPEGGLLHLLITPNSHSTRKVAPLSINMDPDAALQLAHDLNRMANEIKRRERAQSGE